jgi:DNA-binding transcriptional ArsR family regulator
MSKHGSTKDRILKLIPEGKTNLSDISEALGLAPSTVSKHLHDLESAGLIEPKNRAFAPKWKHYQLVAAPEENKERVNAPILNRSAAWKSGIIMSILLLAAVGYLYYSSINSIYVPISITDPPQVPAGTQSLYVNYSSLKVHLVSAGNSSWLSINSSGTLNLLSLINESEVIGSAKIPAGSRIDFVKFNISSASITVDNVTYPVGLPERTIVASVQENRSLNASSGVLLDFSPAVIEQEMQNITSFVLLPSIRAAVIPSPAGLQGPGINNFVYVNARYPLVQAAGAFMQQQANITVLGAALSGSGNTTSLGITLMNNGNSSVTVFGVILGQDEAVFSENTVSNFTGNGNMPYVINASGFGGMGWVTQQHNGSVLINGSGLNRNMQYFKNGTFIVNLTMPTNSIVIVRGSGGFLPPIPTGPGPTGPMQDSKNDIFTVYSNGTMEQIGRSGFGMPMPIRSSSIEEIGYVVPAHGTVSLSYKGAIMLGYHMVANTSGQYSIDILTDRGLVQSNVTTS